MSYNLKKDLLKALGPVKRTLKEYKYYIQDLENQKAKLKKMEEEKQEESDINIYIKCFHIHNFHLTDNYAICIYFVY